MPITKTARNYQNDKQNLVGHDFDVEKIAHIFFALKPRPFIQSALIYSLFESKIVCPGSCIQLCFRGIVVFGEWSFGELSLRGFLIGNCTELSENVNHFVSVWLFNAFAVIWSAHHNTANYKGWKEAKVVRPDFSSPTDIL